MATSSHYSVSNQSTPGKHVIQETHPDAKDDKSVQDFEGFRMVPTMWWKKVKAVEDEV